MTTNVYGTNKKPKITRILKKKTMAKIYDNLFLDQKIRKLFAMQTMIKNTTILDQYTSLFDGANKETHTHKISKSKQKHYRLKTENL